MECEILNYDSLHPYWRHAAFSLVAYSKKALGAKASPSLCWQWTSSIYMWRLGMMYRRLSLQTPFDVVHTHDVESLLAVSPLAVKAPVVHTIHDYYWLGMSSLAEYRDDPKVKDTFKTMERSALVRADRVMAVDTRLKRYAEEYGVDGKKVDVVVNCPGPEFFSLTERRRRRRTSDGGEAVILCARRLVPKNGVRYLVEALALLPRSLKWRAFIAGDGPEYPGINAMIMDRGFGERLKLLGNVPHREIMGLYEKADIAVVPSIHHEGVEEATSISALEAMAAGLPVVASDIGGLSELVDDGRNGFLVKQKNPRQLANVLERLLRDPGLRKRIGQKAHGTAGDKFGPVRHARLVLETYRKAAVGRNLKNSENGRSHKSD